ncbi:MAG TPA: squalene--hopene cyclase, partial [Planctomycetaceae bacterium]|nr:squalene--hopene cyclase [Planctomycetaceae bacterium]
VRLPVVSYALPALIAIGQVRHHFRKPRNPITRFIRNLAVKRSLKKLISIQPTNGGFLEAAPLTSFVTMSLAGMGLTDHPVVQKGLQFLLDSVRPDGSWPIDTNLATWTTTLSVNAIEG